MKAITILALLGTAAADTKYYQISKDCLADYRTNEKAMFDAAKIKPKKDFTDNATEVKE